MGSSYNPSSSAPQLPAWTYTAGSIGTGKFTTNNAAIASTTVITLDNGVAGTWAQGTFANLVPGTQVLLVDAARGVNVFGVTSLAASANNIELTGTMLFRGSVGTGWAGEYTLSCFPVAQTAANVGLGNVPNVDCTNAANITSGAFPALSGVNLLSLNADNLGSGTIPDGRFPASLPGVNGAALTGINVATVELASGISPAADNTYALPTSITIVKGIITAIS